MLKEMIVWHKPKTRTTAVDLTSLCLYTLETMHKFHSYMNSSQREVASLMWTGILYYGLSIGNRNGFIYPNCSLWNRMLLIIRLRAFNVLQMQWWNLISKLLINLQSL